MMLDLNIKTNVAFGKLAGADKSVVGQWINGDIKTIGARYAFNLQDRTSYSARWIMLGNGRKKNHKEALALLNIVNGMEEEITRRKSLDIITAFSNP